MVEAYLHAKFHLDPSKRLATVHQRHRQTDRQDRQDDCPIAQGEPFYKRSPKNVVSMPKPLFSDACDRYGAALLNAHRLTTVPEPRRELRLVVGRHVTEKHWMYWFLVVSISL